MGSVSSEVSRGYDVQCKGVYCDCDQNAVSVRKYTRKKRGRSGNNNIGSVSRAALSTLGHRQCSRAQPHRKSYVIAGKRSDFPQPIEINVLRAVEPETRCCARWRRAGRHGESGWARCCAQPLRRAQSTESRRCDGRNERRRSSRLGSAGFTWLVPASLGASRNVESGEALRRLTSGGFGAGARRLMQR